MRALPEGEGALSFEDFMLHGMGLRTPPPSRAQTASGSRPVPTGGPPGELLIEESAVVGAPLGPEQRARVEAVHSAFDRLGDGNGTVEKHEVSAVDKKGKLFAKLDADSTGHVTVEAFVDYFNTISVERGVGAIEGLLGFMERHVAKADKKQNRAGAVKKVRAAIGGQPLASSRSGRFSAGC